MCPSCPRCNSSNNPCQDRFGSNMLAMGGCMGGVPALGAATEHQKHGTPHVHGEAHIACIYQYGTLIDIANAIRDKLFDPEAVLDFHAWVCREECFREEQHILAQVANEIAWANRYSEPVYNDMSYTPNDMSKDTTETMWSPKPSTLSEALVEGMIYKEIYMQDAQRVASRVQHHFHKRTKHGYVPLPRTCLTKRSGGKCKHGFPMVKRINKCRRVVCRGNAKQFGLNTSGRKNSLGLPINIRTCVWQSGTHPAFIRCFRSNSHTAPNYRLPPHPDYHDDALCKANCWSSTTEPKKFTKEIGFF